MTEFDPFAPVPSSTATVDPPAPEPTVPEPETPDPVDERQLWYCVDVYGPRTPCEPFRSDAHLEPSQRLRCPQCLSDGKSVVRAEQWDAAHPPTKPRDPRLP